MDAAALIAKMEAQRSSWVDLGEGRRVRIVRPKVLEMPDLASGIRVEHAVRFATGWDGFTEATLLGAAHGSGDTLVPFDRAVWEAYIGDNVEEAKLVVDALAERVAEYLRRREETSKNSPPSSTS